mmetsp:Transcript_6641/g.26967  ORF Transcript_6641/g.26967 Transcript_6641/m.26967 type:complete len:332 (+) Transcript_6641:231-1226(+)
MSSLAAADSPTHFCFSSWHVLIEPSKTAVVFSSFAAVAFTVRSSVETVFLHSAMSVSDCSDLPMHSAFAACDALSDAVSDAVSASCFAAHASTCASRLNALFLLSSSKSPCATTWPSHVSTESRHVLRVFLSSAVIVSCAPRSCASCVSRPFLRSLQSPRSAACSLNSPTHSFFSAWHLVMASSMAAVFFLTSSMVTCRRPLRFPIWYFLSWMTLSEACFSPTHVSVALRDAASDAWHAAMSAALSSRSLIKSAICASRSKTRSACDSLLVKSASFSACVALSCAVRSFVTLKLCALVKLSSLSQDTNRARKPSAWLLKNFKSPAVSAAAA